MLNIKTKSWLTVVGGLVLSSVGTSAMALTPEVEGFDNSGIVANIVADGTALPAGETDVSGFLYTRNDSPQPGVTVPAPGVDFVGDEDAFRFYLDIDDNFTADIDYTTIFGGADVIISLFQETGPNEWKFAKGNVNVAGSSLQSLTYNPTAIDNGPGIGGAGNYVLLVSQNSNAAVSGTNFLVGGSGQEGAPWTGMNDGGQGSGSYTIELSGIDAAPAVPVPAAVWLFGSGLMGLVGVARRRKA